MILNAILQLFVVLSFLSLACFLECWKIKLKTVLMWVNYDFWFLTGCGYGYEYNFFSKFKSGCQTARKMSSLHGCSRRIRPFQQGTHMKDRHAVAEGGQFFYRGPAPGPPLVPALAEPTIGIYLSVFGIFRYSNYRRLYRYRYFKISHCRFGFSVYPSLAHGQEGWHTFRDARICIRG